MINLSINRSGGVEEFADLTCGTFFIYPPSVKECKDYYFIKISDNEAFSFSRRIKESFDDETKVYEIFDENIKIDIKI